MLEDSVKKSIKEQDDFDVSKINNQTQEDY